MSTDTPGDDVAGPLLPWDRFSSVPDGLSPVGPLRGEAFGVPAHAQRRAVEAILERFRLEGVTDVRCRARLAVLLHHLGDAASGEALINAIEPPSREDAACLAKCAVEAVSDPLRWWRERGEAACALAGADVPLEPLFSMFSSVRDLDGILRLLKRVDEDGNVDSPDFCYAAASHQIGFGWFLDEAYEALGFDDDPTRACLRAHILFEMLQDDRGLDTLDRLAKAHPKFMPAWDSLVAFHQRCGCRTLEDRALSRIVEVAREGGRRLSSWRAEQYVELGESLGGDAVAAERTRTVLRLHSTPELVEELTNLDSHRPQF